MPRTTRFFCCNLYPALLLLPLCGVARGQCYVFASGTAASLKVSLPNLPKPTSDPTTGITSYSLTSLNSVGDLIQLTVNGTTYTVLPVPSELQTASQSVSASVSYSYQALAPGFNVTGFSIGVTLLVAGLPEGWPSFASLSLFGIGNLLPNGLPASFPPISAWTANPPTLIIDQAYTIDSITNCTASAQPPAINPTDKSLGLPACPCGDPIDSGTGNVFEQILDYSTAGSNKLEFTRYYNSLTGSGTLATTLGKNWRSTYDRYLRIVSPSSVVAERPDGQALNFTLSGATWVSDRDVDLRLVQTGSTWILTDKSDTIETYTSGAGSSTAALLNSIQARNGYTRTLSYNAGNQLTSVVDSYNRALDFSYKDGLIQSLTTPDGLVITFGFSSSGTTAGVLDQLTSATYSSSTTTQFYVYENSSLPFALTGIIDENGTRYASWSYDSQGRGTSSQHAGGADLTIVLYDDTDGSRTVTTALGLSTVYKFSTLQGIPKVIEIDRQASATVAAVARIIAYDTNGYIASQTDWSGNQTTYINDIHGQPTTITEAVGTPQARTTTITYHPNFHLPTKIVTQGLITTFSYDAAGNLLTKTFTDATTTSVPYSTKGQSRTWTYTWANGLMTSVLGPRSDVHALTNFTYDGSGALISTTNALGQVTNITQHTPGGLPETVVDPNGINSQLTYDSRQRLLTKTLNTSVGALTRTNTYDPAGNLISVTLPDGSSLANAYDGAHRLTGFSDLFGQTTAYTLDPMGDRSQTAVLDGSGVLQRQHSANFDALGRLSQDIGGVGQTVGYTLDANGNSTAITDGLGNLTAQSFDAFNRRTTITDARMGVTRISYDAHDRPVSVTDANGGTTSYTYNGFGDLIQTVSPDTGRTIYHYDPAGNLTQKTNAAVVIANFTYDALNRMLTASYPANTSENVNYSYDQAGHGFGIGRLTSVSDAVGTLSRSWDERGNLLSENRISGVATLNTAYSWDLADRLASVTYPSGWVATYTRDAMGRVTTIAAQSPGSPIPVPLISGLTYQPFGPVNALTYGNGIGETLNFDLDYRLNALNDSGANPVQSLSYSYDAGNNVTAIQDRVTSANGQTFGYNPLNRLTSASGVYGTLAYSYDLNGNRLSQTLGSVTTTYDYAPKTNRLVSIIAGGSIQNVGTTVPGNISSFSPAFGSMTNLSYNQSNRLATTSSGSTQLTSYSYDAFGHRLLKTGTTTGTTLYQYDGSSHLLEEADGQGNAQVDYVYLGDRPVATIQPVGGQVYFLHDDRLGTPQMATDSNQLVAWTATYQPFGQISAPAALIAQDLRMPGQESDQETGFYHNGFRDYAPVLGRYVESDPIGILGGRNLFQYAQGNPLRHADPTGLSPVLSEATYEGLQQPIVVPDPTVPIPERDIPLPSIQQSAATPCISDTLNALRNLTGTIGDDLTVAQFLGAKANIPGLAFLDIIANSAAFEDNPTLNNFFALANSFVTLYPPIAVGEAAASVIGVRQPWDTQKP